METGFMSPDGKMYTCQRFEHLSLAKKLCDKFGYLDEIKKLNKFYSGIDCENYLLSKGFLCIYSRNLTHGCIMNATIGNKTFLPVKLSDIQEKFIKDNLVNAFNSEQLKTMYDILSQNESVEERINYFKESIYDYKRGWNLICFEESGESKALP